MPRRWGRSTETKNAPNINASPCEALDGDSLCDSDRALKDTSPQSVCGKNSCAGYPSGVKSHFQVQKLWTYYERGQNYTVQLSTLDPLPRPGIPAAAAAYRQKLRALHLKDKGFSQTEAAKKLQCPARALDDAWTAAAKESLRAASAPPREVAKYIAAYETRMLKAGVEPFREPRLMRGYAKHLTGAYAECASSFPWEQAVLRKRNYETGEVTITSIASSRQDCSFGALRTGLLPHLDDVLAKIKTDFEIEDPGAYLLCNWYPDGKTNIASHQHDFWSAILSFGAPRIFLLDGQPVLLEHGDLLVFGTQRHSVPKMPAAEEGRISVCIFWYPERTKADGVFTIALDPSLTEGALSNDALAEAIANAAAAKISHIPLDTNGRGVGKLENQALFDDEFSDADDGNDLMDEDRLLAIALEVSMMEQ